jgi:metal-responsive CopG/Arc/MetJ family transcriptional regulator
MSPETLMSIERQSGDEPVRVNISLPSSALEALDRTVKELSLTRSGAIAYLALEKDARREPQARHARLIVETRKLQE